MNGESKKSHKAPSLANKLLYEKRIQKLGLFTLERRRMKGDLIESYKVLHSLKGVDENTFFKKTTVTLRGRNLKLHHMQVRLDIRKFFFARKLLIIGTGYQRKKYRQQAGVI